MAPSRGRGKSKASQSRMTRSSKQAGPADVYEDLLAEAAVIDPSDDHVDSRPLKRRRVAASIHAKALDNGDGSGMPEHETTKIATAQDGRNLQTMEASSDSDESDFEDVDLHQAAAISSPATSDADEGLADVTLSVDASATPKRRSQPVRRKPASVAEKAQRLIVHKAHFLCLLGHCVYVNSWCNDQAVHRSLQKIVTPKTRLFITPKASLSQFERNRSFMKGLGEASEAFRGAFRITASGMRRTNGDFDSDKVSDVEPVDRADFVTAAKRLEGSQDTGNQLFCALLRSVGVDARMVCSLQTVSLASTPSKPSTPKPAKPIVLAIASDTDLTASDASADDASVKSSSSIGKVPSVRRRLGQPTFSSPLVSDQRTPSGSERKKKSIRRLTYPIYWVEAFDAAHQRWVPIDPIVTQTVDKSTKFEPPFSYEFNQMSYVIALENHGVAKDVTRRYAKAYNAKTRRSRVESTENGTLWFKKALRFLRRRGPALDRDQVEDAELVKKEAREGLPTNVVDFKHHPYYALERHLRRHEVLHPKREVGRVNAGTAKNPRMEAVFRRSDVVACRSADKWFRVGREVKEGEQPLKRVVARRRTGRAHSPTDEDEDAGEERTTALYAHFQTAAYVPPPVVDGRVPFNAFGNLDMYVPSMVPSGGTHIRHAMAKEAAAHLKVDFVEAVTGFTFKGRQGTVVIEGGVVASEVAADVVATIGEILKSREETRCRNRSLTALRLWKRFLTGLRITERVEGYGKGKRKETAADESLTAAASDGDVAMVMEDKTGDIDDGDPLLTAGKFTIEQLLAPPKPASGKKKSSKRKKLESEDDEEDDEDDEDELDGHASHWSPAVTDDETSAPTSGRVTRSRKRAIVFDDVEDDDERGGSGDGGGFVPDDAMDMDGDEHGGGFITEDVDPLEMSRDGIADERGGGFVPEGSGGEELADPDDGGGFLPDEGEGGFLPEDGVVEADQPEHGKQQSEVISNGTDLEKGEGGSESNPSPTDDIDIEQRHASDGSFDPAASTIRETAQDNELLIPAPPSDPPAVDINFKRKAEQGAQQVSETAASVSAAPSSNMAQEEEEEEKGSLLSHDPEDEDAEPDWLESD